MASIQTINRALHVMGLSAVAGDKKVFVNYPPELLVEEMYGVLPADRCIVETPERSLSDPVVAAACRRLRANGYELSLDDVVEPLSSPDVLQLASYVKLDLRALPEARRRPLVAMLTGLGCRVVAQKVESRDEHQMALDAGCHFAQGYFFCRPELLVGKSLAGSELVHLQLLKELGVGELDYAVLEAVIKRDAALALKLLRYLNSASVGLRHKITSIRQALSLLGEKAIRKWGTLVTLTSAGRKRPHELLVTALVRAQFCENVAQAEGLADRGLELFLIGLLSLADSVFEIPMAQVLEQTGAPESTRQVLLSQPEAPAELVRILQLAKACERGAWGEVAQVSTSLKQTQSELAVLFYEALAWADQAIEQAA